MVQTWIAEAQSYLGDVSVSPPTLAALRELEQADVDTETASSQTTGTVSTGVSGPNQQSQQSCALQFACPICC